MPRKGEWYPPNQKLFAYKYFIKHFEGKINPPKHDPEKPELTFFGNQKKRTNELQYDIYYSFTDQKSDFDKRRTRDNRPYQQDIRNNIFEQEKHKAIPALVSLDYGHRKLIEKKREKQFEKCSQLRDFYRKNGVTVTSDEATERSFSTFKTI